MTKPMSGAVKLELIKTMREMFEDVTGVRPGLRLTRDFVEEALATADEEALDGAIDLLVRVYARRGTPYGKEEVLRILGLSAAEPRKRPSEEVR